LIWVGGNQVVELKAYDPAEKRGGCVRTMKTRFDSWFSGSHVPTSDFKTDKTGLVQFEKLVNFFIKNETNYYSKNGRFLQFIDRF
jgi:hypothetical protein